MDTISKFKNYIVDQVKNKNLSAADAAEYLENLSLKKDLPEHSPTEIAVIGYDCKLPKADGPDQFWDNILNNKDCVGAFPKNRMDDVIYVNENTYDQYKLLNCRVGGYLDTVDQFDYKYFGLSPIEARDMDPSHRLFLETSVRALEHAGLTKKRLDNSKTGVFVGYSVCEDMFADLLGKDNPNLAMGNQPAMLPYRLAFMYNLKGPTMAIDTSCSSSLVTLHMAKRAIQNGDCDQAIVAGVNLRIFPAIREIANLGIEAFDGKCKPFDSNANGTNIGDGIVTVVLKRKDLAIKEKDKIHALVLGSAINSDGASNGLSSPNPDAQADVLKKCWDEANVHPENIDFIETHGTGTRLGDPIEIHGLTLAAKKYTEKTQFIPLGSVKANVGHLEASAGIVGLLKSLLCIKNRKLPNMLHFSEPNMYIDFKSSPVYVPQEIVSWDDKNKNIIAGVSSFGITGTNSHVLLGGHPGTDSKNTNIKAPCVIFISGKSINSLLGNAQKYMEFCAGNNSDIASISYSTVERRDHHQYRLAVLANDLADLSRKLQDVLSAYEKNQDPGILGVEDVYYANVEQKNYVNLNSDDIDTDKLMLIENYLTANPTSWEENDDGVLYTPLPTYVFDSIRCWPKLTIDKEEENANRINDLFYKITWTEQAINLYEGDVNTDKFQLLFLRDNKYSQSLIEHAKSKGAKLIVVHDGAEFKQIDNSTYEINIENESDYEQIFSDLRNGSVEIDTIVHGFDWCQETTAISDYDHLIDGQNYGVLSMYHMVNALEKQYKNISCKIATLSTNAHQVTGDESDLDPSRMTALGVNKVVSQEYPMIESVFMDCDVPEDTEKQVAMIFDEAIVRPHLVDHIVAIRNQHRYRQILRRMEQSEIEKAQEPLIKEGLTYLIAGGSGYLGMETALHLAKKEKVNIAIASRSDHSVLNETDLKEQSEPKLQKMVNIVREIRSLGSEIKFFQGDVTDLAQCQSVLAQCRKQFKTINGIFLTIKNISHKRLSVVSFDEFRSNIQAKLKAVYHLNKETENDPIDLFVMFSSISSLTGGPTGADCSASNLFLDSYGDYRNSIIGKRTIILNYTLIDADDGSLDSDRLTMIPPLTKEECFKCMDVFLDTNLNFAVMADFASNVTHKVLSFMKVNFSDDVLQEFSNRANKGGKTKKIAPVEAEAEIQTTLTEKELEAAISKAISEILGHSRIQPYDNFFEIGGDSISAIKLIDRLKNITQMEVDISILYDYPCVADLTNYFVKGDKSQTQADLPDQAPRETNISDLLDKMSDGQLSLEEVAEQL